MKKIIIIVLAIVLLLVAALVLTPFLFKPRLVEAARTAINKQLNATVEFAGFDVSLFRDFPKATMVISDLSVTGKDEFQGDTLFYASSVNASMNLFSLFKSSGRSIEKIVIRQPLLNLLVNKNDKANWDVTLESEPGQAVQNQPEESEKPFEIKLEKIEIENGRMVYSDEISPMKVVLAGINLDVDGKMYGNSTALQLTGKAADFLFEYDSTKYISGVALETKSAVNVDFDRLKVDIATSDVWVNRLPLQLTGWIEMPADSQIYNLQFATKSSEFENFLALVPADYAKYLENLTTSGIANVSGKIAGVLYEEDYPEMLFDVTVENGLIQYKGLPEKIEKISGLISVQKPQGSLDLTELNISGLHAEIKRNPVDFALNMKQLMTDPQFEGSLVGKINFTDIKEVLKADSMNLAGLIDANLRFKGVYSDVEKGSYEKIKAEGTVRMHDFIYSSPELSQEVKIPAGLMEFSPIAVNLKQLDMKVGESDFGLNGQVKDYLNYVFGKGVLKGDLQLQSGFINITQLMALQKNPAAKNSSAAKTPSAADSVKTSESKQIMAFDVPENVSFTFRSAIKKAVFDKLEMNYINGNISVADGKLTMNGLSMNTLGGDVKVTGSYKNTPQKQPFFDFTFDVNSVDIPVAFSTLGGIKQLAPVASQSVGKISTALKMSGQLKPDLSIIPTSVDAVAQLSTFGLMIKESPVFSQLKNIIKPELLKNVTVDDFKANLTVDKGNIGLKPFKTKIAGQETVLSGTLNAESLLNMKMDFVINRDAFGQDIKNILSAIPGNDKIQLLPASVLLNGPVGKPEVKLDLTETKDVVAKAAKGELKNSLNKLGKELQKLF